MGLSQGHVSIKVVTRVLVIRLFLRPLLAERCETPRYNLLHGAVTRIHFVKPTTSEPRKLLTRHENVVVPWQCLSNGTPEGKRFTLSLQFFVWFSL